MLFNLLAWRIDFNSSKKRSESSETHGIKRRTHGVPAETSKEFSRMEPS